MSAYTFLNIPIKCTIFISTYIRWVSPRYCGTQVPSSGRKYASFLKKQMPCDTIVSSSIFCSGFVVKIDMMYKIQMYVAYCRDFYVYSMVKALCHN